ncbi:glycosyltransferase family protein [Rhizobium alarense]|uniref:glycosyl transferase family 1 n=1 Tax=Rhizobium alarense TaxID=2846851 RepID=UPI002E37223A|nr:glycosyl transferase family 1 [Rhizobium alarense]
MPNVLYLVHDLSDPAVRRRVRMLKAGGAELTLAGFRRGDDAVTAVEGVAAIELGQTADARFGHRLAAVARACLRIGDLLRSAPRPDVIIARNLEMLAVANRVATRYGNDVAIVYECLDIHRLLLRDDAVGRALRLAEARLGRNVGLLLTSSPAFVESYFRPLSGIRAPVQLVENRMLELDPARSAPAVRSRPPAPGAPWRIGWFGALRCRKSLELLAAFTRVLEGQFEVVLRGRPARSEFPDFDGFVAREPYLRFEGPYRNPEDVAAIYDEVQFVWAIDFFEEGLNSSWLLPNRLYEGCRHGAVPIVVAGTETARFVAAHGIGLTLPEPTVDRLSALLAAMDATRYRAAYDAVAAEGEKPWIYQRADCVALVRRLAGLPRRTPCADNAPAYPDLVATKVDYHDR